MAETVQSEEGTATPKFSAATTSSKKFPSPSKWFVAVKSPSGNCIFPSWSDCQRSQVDFSSSNVELAAFPTIQQASVFLDSSASPSTPAAKCLDSTASTDSSSTDTSPHLKKIPSVPKVVVLSTDDEDGSPPANVDSTKKRKLYHEDDAGVLHKDHRRQIREVTRLTDFNGNLLPIFSIPKTATEEYLEASLRFRQQQRQHAAFVNPAFANLVNAATSMSTSHPTLAASYLMNMSSAPSAFPRNPDLAVTADTSASSTSADSGWSKLEDAKLRDIMTRYRKVNSHNWTAISEEMGLHRSAEECQQRWVKHLKPGVRKGQWTEDEDAFILRSVSTSGEQPFTRWSELALHMPGRHGKQIRERWINHLNPHISHLPFTEEDDLKLWQAAQKYGKKWVEISSKYFDSTRAENQIKNRWYSAAFKKFIVGKFGEDAYT
jgi:Myb-like DNA-binding domain